MKTPPRPDATDKKQALFKKKKAKYRKKTDTNRGQMRLKVRMFRIIVLIS